jgi:hypothetical protein
LLVVISASTLLGSYLFRKALRSYRRSKQQSPFNVDDEELEAEVEVAPPAPFLPSQGLWSDLLAHINSMRVYGSVIVALDVLRTLCLCALLGLTIYAAIQAEVPPVESHDPLLEELKKKKKKKKPNRSPIDYTTLEWGELGACVFYVSSFCGGPN